MYKYTLAVTSPEYWNTIHNALIVDSNEDGIPDRKVDCSDCKEHSPTRGTYWLTEAEATGISTHPQVKWIELSPSDYPYSYPEPEPDTKRFRKNVKVYRNLPTTSFSISATSAEENRTNWAVKRVGVQTNGDGWPNTFGTQVSPITSDISYSLTGKNVDLVIQDSGVLQYHPEFLDDDGKSRVRDVILDGPYYIDPSYFTSNSYTYTKPDGRIGITTASAHSWWENSSNRSGSFSSVGTISVPDAYTVANSLGIGGSSHTMTSSHGTGCAGLSAGRNFGLAFEANIWTISIFAPANIATEASYDAIKILHQNKPLTAGRKNPTVVNGSWGYFAGFNSGTQVYYSFKGSEGNFTGYSSSSTGVQALAYGLDSGSVYDKHFATSSRSNSTETAGDEMSAAGVIFVTSAGNDNQRLGIGSDDPHINDYLTTLNSADTRSGIPQYSGGGTCPSGHRNWIHPSNVGFDHVNDSHPAICVGAMDDTIEQSYAGYEHELYAEMKASYSNNGPGIDVWAPADETLSAGMRATNGDSLGDINYSRYNSNFVDMYFNGTSAASPVVAGMVALFLESKPDATSGEVKEFLLKQGSVGVSTDKYLDPFPTDDNQYYWSTNRNLRGSSRNVLFDPFASDTRPTFTGVIGGENIVTNGLVLNLDGNNYTSGSTWNDSSGGSRNATLINSPTSDTSNGGSIVFDDSNPVEYAQTSTSSSFLIGTKDYTMSLWFKFDDVKAEMGLMDNRTAHGNGTTFGIFQSGSYMRVKVWEDNANTFGFQSSTNLSVNTWYNITYTRISNSATMYINGVKDGSSWTQNYNYTSGNKVTVAWNYSLQSNKSFDGSIGQVLFYVDKGFTESEVLQNYNAMKGRYLDNPLILSGISFSLT